MRSFLIIILALFGSVVAHAQEQVKFKAPLMNFSIDVAQNDFLQNRPDEVRQYYWMLQAMEDVQVVSVKDMYQLFRMPDGMDINRQLIYRKSAREAREKKISILFEILKHNDWGVVNKYIEDFVRQNTPSNTKPSPNPVSQQGTCWKCITGESYLTLGILTAFRFDEIKPISLAGWYRGAFHLDNFWRDGNTNKTNYWDLKSPIRGHMPMGVVAQEIFAQNDPKTLKAITERIGWNSDYGHAKLRQWLFSVDYAVAFEWGVFFLPVKVKDRWIVIPLPNPFNESFMGGVGSSGINKKGTKNKHALVDILGGTSTCALALSVGFDLVDRYVVRPYFFDKYEGSRWRYIMYPLGALAIFPKSFARVAAFHSPFAGQYH